jgi:hypothetical protein
MPGLFTRIKNWIQDEKLLYSDLNAEINNLITKAEAQYQKGHSDNVTQMQLTEDPGDLSSEVTGTTISVSDEIERMRYVIQRMLGKTYWYQPASTTIEELNSTLEALAVNPGSRIVSGRTRSATDSFPIYLTPGGGSNQTCALKGFTTNFSAYIDGALQTISTDVVKSGMSLAPSTNNTCLVNDATLTGQAASKSAGESDADFPVITIGTVGSEISVLVGKYAAFKKGTEYFVAYVNSATELKHARRGYFFDDTDAPITRAALTNGDTITLCRLHWVFLINDGTLATTTGQPAISSDEPTSPANGDYWWDIQNKTWKTYNGSAFVAANAILIGFAVTDTAGCVAARSLNFHAAYADTNTIKLEKYDNATVRSSVRDAVLSVAGTLHSWAHGYPSWSMVTDLEAGLTEGSSRDYFFYVTENGDLQIAEERPYDRRADLYGWYHPYHNWRCVGRAANDGSSNLGTAYDIAPAIRSKMFTSSGSWVCPPGVYTAMVSARGGSGGGAGGRSNWAMAGGGGGGCKSVARFIQVTPGEVINITIGAAGAGGGLGSAGGSGGTTTVGSYLSCPGASGGSPSDGATDGGSGGAGRPAYGGKGSGANGTGTVGTDGGNNESGNGGATGLYDGGGGGGGGAGDGNGGAGGNGGIYPGTNATAGSAGTNGGGGGGGGGGSQTTAGAAGGAGSAGYAFIAW